MRFDDPGLTYGTALSKTVGRLVVRAADAPRSGSIFGDFAAPSRRYLDELNQLAADQREKDRAPRRRAARRRLQARRFALRPDRRPADKRHHAALDAAAPECCRPSEARAPPTRMPCSAAKTSRRPRPRRGSTRRWRRSTSFYRPAGPSMPAVVQEPRLRARHAHRLWRQDPARRPRGDRGAPLRRCRTYVGRTAAVIENYANRLDEATALGRSAT